jgi:hypothetical protein
MAGTAWQQIRDAAFQGRGARSPSIPTSWFTLTARTPLA